MTQTTNNPFQGAERLMSFLKKLSIIPVVVLVILILAPTMFYTVAPEEDAVVLRFGKYNRTEGPGLHIKWPLNLESANKVATRMVLKMEFGFRTKSAGVVTVYDEGNYLNESMMLTGDLNVVDLSWIIQYQIKNAKDYLFNVDHVDVNLYDISQAVMREVVGDRTVNEAITEARDEIEVSALKQMQEIVDSYNMGISLVALKLQDVTPPEKVKPSFDDVNAAVQDASQIANMANKQRQKVLQEERGKAEQNIKNAEAYKVDVVNRAKGDASRFAALYEEYKKDPEVTKKRLYFDSLKEVLKKTDKVYVVDPDVKSVVPLLQMKGSN